MVKPIIEANNVSFQYPHTEHPFLQEITAQINPGEVILICGESGSGKTTFGRLLNGISPDYIEGDLTGELRTRDLLAGEHEIEDYVHHVGSVFQNPKTQHFALNTTHELAFPCENIGMEPEAIKERIAQKSVDYHIEGLMGRDIFNLSGGEKQQIAFVSSTMLNPEILVLDEVTSNLDFEAVERIKEMIVQLKNQGKTIVLTEHRLSWAKEFIDRVFYFERGKLKEIWSKQDFGQMTNKDLHSYGLRSLHLGETRKRIEQLTQKEITASNGLLLKDLTIGYKNQKPVQTHLNQHFEKGAITGLLGGNGSGKSTLAQHVTGLKTPKEGTIYLDNKEMTSKELLKKSALVMQDTNYQLFGESVEADVLLGAEYPEKMEEVLGSLDLLHVKDQHPMSLSGGQKQRVAIAQALLSGKEIIIFDEPTSGLDYRNMVRFGDLLDDLKRMNTVVIVITHDLELTANYCDSIVQLTKS